MKRKTAFMLFVLLSILVVSQTIIGQSGTGLTELYTSEVFSVSYPAGWIPVVEDDDPEVAFYSDALAASAFQNYEDPMRSDLPANWQLINIGLTLDVNENIFPDVYSTLNFSISFLEDQVEWGESEEVVFGNWEGIVIPTIFVAGDLFPSEGTGSMYFLRNSTGSSLVIIGLGFGTSVVDENLLENIIMSIVVEGSTLTLSNGEVLEFSQLYVEQDMAFAYPDEWVVFEQNDYLLVASSQDAADAIVSSDDLPSDDLIAVQISSFDTGGIITAVEVIELFVNQSVSGERTELTSYGSLSGVSAPIVVSSTGEMGSIYFVSYDENTVLVIIGFVEGYTSVDLNDTIETLISTIKPNDDDSDDSSGGGDSGGFNFSEQFSQEGVSFTYPEGWVLVDDGGQVVIANNQAAADAIVAGGNPPADAIAVLFIPFPTGGAFTASEVANLFTQEAVSEDGLQFGSDLTETTIGDYSGVRADVTIPETDDGPGGEGALYVIDYSENIVFVAVGVGTVEDNSQITAVIENMINTLEVDEAALTSPAG